jgi:DNA (cytosine-5)-methyltransferase 1
MDTSKAVTHLGLCAGYGGIELGLKRAIPSLRTIALCEIEAFAIANLVSKMEAGLMDPAPIWPDLKTFPWAAFRDRVDILTGGYPCQPFSAAGQRKGKQDPRHLWPWIADGIRLLRPQICFFENVEGHISLGLSDVIEDLAGMGYRTTWGIFSASEVGAPHQRKRVFILAVASGFRGTPGLSGPFPRDEGQPRESDHCGDQVMADSECSRSSTGRIDARRQEVSQSEHCSAWPSRPGEQQYGWEPLRVVGNTESRQDNGREPGDMGEEASQGGCDDHAADGAGKDMADSHRIDRSAQAEGREHDRQAGSAGEELGNAGCERQEERQLPSGWSKQSDSRQTQPPLGGDTDGFASGMDYAQLCVSGDNRTDELRLLGNGVVPATAERAFRVLIKELL